MPSVDYASTAKREGYEVTAWKTKIPAGPYFMSATTGEVFQAFLLYSDVQGAFTSGVRATPDGTYTVLDAALIGAQSGTIGVPSRLYYTKTESKPLAGVRLGVKDIYDIAGIKSSLGNRAYYEFYPPRTATATAVQRLVNAGAVIVGKMKTSQFANGETATADWVDYHSPFNPRGDGYQDPSSSSSGPGAGVGAYDWLDLAIGSDTGGSIRNPSQVNGCYGNRPTWGLVPLDGVMPLSPPLDTAGLITLDPILWYTAAQVLYETNITTSNFKSFPKNIITSGFPEAATTEADGILLDFLLKLTSFLKATSSALNYNTLWESTIPAAAGNTSIADYLDIVYPVLISQDQFNEVALPFYAAYGAANEGRRPFIDPVPLIRWGFGQNNVSSNATDIALEAKAVFTDWWAEEVVKPSAESCSESILLYPGTVGTPTYRNAYRRFVAPSYPLSFVSASRD
jgi:hypothetical protein